MACSVCKRSLSRAQWSKDGTLKSCPSCSQANGSKHVFFDYPSKFGTTQLRSTPSHPEGPQSHCSDCRGKGTTANLDHAIYCTSVDIK